MSSKRTPTNLVDTIKIATDEVKAVSKMLVGQGDYDATHRHLKVKRDSMGIIHAVLAKGPRLYAAVVRLEPLTNYGGEHGSLEFYNCKGETKNYGAHELFMRVINVNLSRDIVDPRDFIGQKVLVTELDNIPVKVELIGDVEGMVENPTTLSSAVLRSFRNFLGPSKPLDDDSELTETFMQAFGIDPDFMKNMMALKIEDVAGKVLRIEGDAVYFMDTDKEKEGYMQIKNYKDMYDHLSTNPMKTKDCHLPIKVFGAR